MKSASLKQIPHDDNRAPRGARRAHAKEPSLLSHVGRTVCAFLLLFICAESAAGIPLSVYRERVRRAIVAVGSIKTTPQYQSNEDRRLNAAALEDVRRALPANESVEWNETTFRVDNSWLVDMLDTYESMAVDEPLRAEWLARMVERLQSLDQRLSELEKGAGPSINKEEEKARLAAILRRDEYNSEAAEGNALTRLFKSIREWLQKLFPKGSAREPAASSSRAVNSTARILVAALSIAVILYVGWKFLPRIMRRDLKKRKKRKREARVVLGEQLSADQTSADILTEAEALARAGDVRGAIRRGYIALLCELHDRKLLLLAQHKTNRDYLRAVESNPQLYEEMKPMTASFESHWYGFMPATESDWQTFRSRYRQALRQ